MSILSPSNQASKPPRRTGRGGAGNFRSDGPLVPGGSEKKDSEKDKNEVGTVLSTTALMASRW
jgi:hypothetical protein